MKKFFYFLLIFSTLMISQKINSMERRHQAMEATFKWVCDKVTRISVEEWRAAQDDNVYGNNLFIKIQVALSASLIINTIRLIKQKKLFNKKLTEDDHTISIALSLIIYMIGASSSFKVPICLTPRYKRLKQCSPDLEETINVQFFAILVPIVLATLGILNNAYDEYSNILEEARIKSPNKNSNPSFKEMFKTFKQKSSFKKEDKICMCSLQILVISIFMIQLYFSSSC